MADNNKSFFNVDKDDLAIDVDVDEHGDFSPAGVTIEDDPAAVEAREGPTDNPDDLEVGSKDGNVISVPEEFFDKGEDSVEEKEETKPGKSETKVEGTSKGEVSGDSSNPMTLFAKSIREAGLLGEVSDEDLNQITDTASLSGVLENFMLDTFNNYKQHYLKNSLKVLQEEGLIKAEDIAVGVPDNLTEDQIKGNETKQEEILKEYYKELGMSDERIKRNISNVVDLEEEALDIYPEYKALLEKKQSSALQRQEMAEKTKKENEEKYAKSLYNSTVTMEEPIPGVKINKQTKEKAYTNIENVIDKLNKEPTKYLPLLSYLDLYGVLDGKWDKVTKNSKSSARDELMDALSKSGRRKNFESFEDTTSEEDNSIMKAARNSLGSIW